VVGSASTTASSSPLSSAPVTQTLPISTASVTAGSSVTSEHEHSTAVGGVCKPRVTATVTTTFTFTSF
jgi:hypothetical protein